VHDGQWQLNRTDIERDAQVARGSQARLAGKPMQNGFVETFNGRIRDECLNEHLFDNLRKVRNLVAAWRIDFNYHGPHSSLAGLTPTELVNRSKEDQNPKRANLK
jgi:putative transposase